MNYSLQQLILIKDSSDLLSKHFGSEIVITGAELLKDGPSAQTFRLRLAMTTAGIPNSLIVKRIRMNTADADLGYNDLASLSFLSAARKTRSFVPRFFAGDKNLGLYYMEDLGPSLEMNTVWKKLNEADEIFLDHARASAGLAAVTGLREAEFEHVITQFPVPNMKKRYVDGEKWREGVSKFREWLTVLNVSERQGLPAEILRLAINFEEPGKLLSFSHGDFAPSNLHVTPETKHVRILGFEYGGYRNALYDITAWNILCPLRDELIAQARAEFRDEFIKKYEFTIDASEIDRAWIAMSLYRAIALFSRIGIDVFEKDKPWVGEWSCRLALMKAATRARQAAQESADYPELLATFTDIEAKFRGAWSDLRN